jgi:REP-associated tyrosine transposase
VTFDPNTHHRRSIRLRGYEYSRPGAYFITVCTVGKKHLFGEVVEGEIHLNQCGEIVASCWQSLEKSNTNLELDEWVVMPNHFHGIVVIRDSRGGSRTASS